MERIFSRMAASFSRVFGEDALYFAPGSATGVPCRPILREPSVVHGAESRKPELTGHPDTLGKFVDVPVSEVAAPLMAGRFVFEASGESYSIVGKPVRTVDGPALWICKVT